MSVMPARHPVTVDQFDRMVEAGVFGPDERLELIGGEIVDMSPIGSRHQACVDRLTSMFAPALPGRAIVRVQGSVRITDLSQPQPDLALLRPRDDFYVDAHPGPADVLLVVEVADTSLSYDRWTKLPLYAKAGVPEAWVIDLNGGVVDIAAQPGEHGYGVLAQRDRDGVLSPAAFPDLSFPVVEVLGMRTTAG
jgi:Uma2 family endonuclease